MPTGTAIRDPRGLLFDAAQRVLLHGGVTGLTSRTVTAEAGVAKGVLHRHFTDFDAFLAEFAEEHIARIGDQAAGLRRAAGTGPIDEILAVALTELFTPVTLALIRLVIARDELRRRLRQAGHGRLPVASQATAMLAAYLAAERDLGRLAPDADIDSLVLALTGAAHLEFAVEDAGEDAGGVPAQGGAGGVPADAPGTDAMRKLVTAVLAGAVR